MKECFEVRYNLDKMAYECAPDVAGALSALFGNPKAEIEESIAYYNEKADENARALKARLGDAVLPLANKKIVFFGDSITSDRLSYANLIIRSGIFAAARESAISGISSNVMIQRLCGGVRADDYDYVCVYIGTNDEFRMDGENTLISPAEYERNIRLSAEKIKARGAKGLFVKICGRKDDYGICPPDKFNEILERVAKEYDFLLADANEISPEFIEDRIHLTEAAQLRLAESILKILAKNEEMAE